MQPGSATIAPNRPASDRPKHSSVQVLLLILGVALVTIAVFAFASFAYGLLGDVGRSICIAVVGLAALITGFLATARLRVTAEGLTWAGLAALTIDTALIADIPLVKAAMPDDAATSIAIFVIVALAWGLRLIQTRTNLLSRATVIGIPNDPGNPTATGTGGGTVPTEPVKNAAYPADSKPLPLRAYSLYSVFALPFAVTNLAFILPVEDSGAQGTLAFTIGSLAAVIIAAAIRPAARSRAADFEWIAAIILAMVTMSFLSIGISISPNEHHPLWLMLTQYLLTPTVWALMLAVLRMKRAARTGKPIRAGSRIVPTFGFFWSLAVCIDMLVTRILDLPGGTPLTQTVSAAIAISVAAIALVLGCLWPRTDTMFSTPERATASVTGSFLLLVSVMADFSHGSPLPMLMSLVSYVVLLAVCVVAWLRIARPEPLNQLSAAQIIETCATAIAGLILVGMACIDPQPHVPVDLITVLSGVATLIVGVRWLQLRPQLRSWPALWPALTLLTVPSLLMSWVEWPSFARLLALFTIAIFAMLYGASESLQAPLVYGAATLVISVLTVLWPWLADFSRHYWWVWLLIGGVILIVAAARYEASVQSMHRLADRINELR